MLFQGLSSCSPSCSLSSQPFCFRSFSGLQAMAEESVTYLTQREAAEVDETLMGPLGFSVEQLMVSSRLTVLGVAEVFFVYNYCPISA